MRRLFKRSLSQSPLGHLESCVMDVVWAHGESNVRDVAEKIDRPLAYTTVMTTLDRLYKKGMLERRKSERAFLYSPKLSRRDWERQCAGELVAGFLSGPRWSGEDLISCFLDEVVRNASLFDELERKIKIKREELGRRKP
ncbi:MAG TPA: BlaI/MecI/CopY family transcriptional regulator [Bryobacteraceae bacterium]|nr:BlaI/MecI/CopY family transcriptional regulator [Bryobacteraceae bacterium]